MYEFLFSAGQQALPASASSEYMYIFNNSMYVIKRNQLKLPQTSDFIHLVNKMYFIYVCTSAHIRMHVCPNICTIQSQHYNLHVSQCLNHKCNSYYTRVNTELRASMSIRAS